MACLPDALAPPSLALEARPARSGRSFTASKVCRAGLAYRPLGRAGPRLGGERPSNGPCVACSSESSRHQRGGGSVSTRDAHGPGRAVSHLAAPRSLQNGGACACAGCVIRHRGQGQSHHCGPKRARSTRDAVRHDLEPSSSNVSSNAAAFRSDSTLGVVAATPSAGSQGGKVTRSSVAERC